MFEHQPSFRDRTISHRRHRHWYCLILLLLIIFPLLLPNGSGDARAAALERPAAITNQVGGTTTFKGSAPVRVLETEVIDSPWTEIHRERHTATLLTDGKVLLVGGEGSDRAPATAETFEPRMQSIRLTKPLVQPRTQHTATLLRDGRVLIVGGFDPASRVARGTEIYQPTMRSFVLAKPIPTPRAGHTATLLPSGKVLVTGGFDPKTEKILRSVELYDPATNSWTTLGGMSQPRHAHTATLLKNGKVLVVGGYVTPTSVAGAELYDSATNRWSSGGTMQHNRAAHTATLLRDGRVLMTGGDDASSVDGGPDAIPVEQSSEIFDPVGSIWTPSAYTYFSHINNTATLLPDNTVMVIGAGGDPRETPNYATTIEVFDPVTGNWDSRNDYLGNRRWHTTTLLNDGTVLVHSGFHPSFQEGAEYPFIYDPKTTFWAENWMGQLRRFGHTATLLPNGRTLFTGGYEFERNSGSVTSKATMYNPANAAFVQSGSLTEPRVYHTATLLRNGQVLIVGAYDLGGETAEVFDPSTGITVRTGKVLSARSYHTATFLPNGKVLVTGGSVNNEATASAELYDPSTRTWTPAGTMHEARASHTATLLPNGKVLVVGGFVDSQGEDRASAELYDPGTNTFVQTGNMLNVRSEHTATLLKDGTVLIAGGNTPWTTGSLEFYNPSTQTFTYLIDSYIVPRYAHTATLLRNGNVMFIGGYGDNLVHAIEIYEPTTQTVKYEGYLRDARYAHTTTLMPDGSLLIFGGDYAADPYAEFRRTELASYSTTNTVTGTLTLPSGWIRGTTPITITGRSATAPVASGRIDAGDWFAAKPGQNVVTQYRPTEEGAKVPVRLSLQDTNGHAATVVTGTLRVDLTAPASTVQTLAATSPRQFTLSWSGTDTTSGVATYDVEVRQGTSGAWTPLVSNTTARAFTFTGEYGRLYGFRVRARDNAGNIEVWPAVPDASTRIQAVPSAQSVYLPSLGS